MKNLNPISSGKAVYVELAKKYTEVLKLSSADFELFSTLIAFDSAYEFGINDLFWTYNIHFILFLDHIIEDIELISPDPNNKRDIKCNWEEKWKLFHKNVFFTKNYFIQFK